MARSFKHTPIFMIAGGKLSTARWAKRHKAKAERHAARIALARGLDADFAFTPGQTWDIGDGKTYYCRADARLLRK